MATLTYKPWYMLFYEVGIMYCLLLHRTVQKRCLGSMSQKSFTLYSARPHPCLRHGSQGNFTHLMSTTTTLYWQRKERTGNMITTQREKQRNRETTNTHRNASTAPRASQPCQPSHMRPQCHVAPPTPPSLAGSQTPKRSQYRLHSRRLHTSGSESPLQRTHDGLVRQVLSRFARLYGICFGGADLTDNLDKKGPPVPFSLLFSSVLRHVCVQRVESRLLDGGVPRLHSLRIIFRASPSPGAEFVAAVWARRNDALDLGDPGHGALLMQHMSAGELDHSNRVFFPGCGADSALVLHVAWLVRHKAPEEKREVAWKRRHSSG
jgi:hypothetical protein